MQSFFRMRPKKKVGSRPFAFFWIYVDALMPNEALKYRYALHLTSDIYADAAQIAHAFSKNSNNFYPDFGRGKSAVCIILVSVGHRLDRPTPQVAHSARVILFKNTCTALVSIVLKRTERP